MNSIAAVSYRNGSKFTIAKVEGKTEYNELLARISLASSQHIAFVYKSGSKRQCADIATRPPYTNFPDAFNDRPRQELRKARKAIGLPASEDVGVLASMLKGLVDAVESRLGCRLGSAAATSPHLLALYEEDMGDAFEYLHLNWLRLPVRYSHLRETSAAYAGYGFGLCTNFTDLSVCKDELQNWPSEVVMAVLYTRFALTVSLSVTKSAYYLWELPYRHVEDFSLGRNAKYDNPREEYYWESLRRCLLDIMVHHQYFPRPAKMLLLGESAHDERFNGVLTEALGSVMESMPAILQEGAEDVGAHGAAEFAMRSPWDPYRPLQEETLERMDLVEEADLVQHRQDMFAGGNA